jgi:hypothetical protein
MSCRAPRCPAASATVISVTCRKNRLSCCLVRFLRQGARAPTCAPSRSSPRERAAGARRQCGEQSLPGSVGSHCEQPSWHERRNAGCGRRYDLGHGDVRDAAVWRPARSLHQLVVALRETAKPSRADVDEADRISVEPIDQQQLAPVGRILQRRERRLQSSAQDAHRAACRVHHGDAGPKPVALGQPEGD